MEQLRERAIHTSKSDQTATINDMSLKALEGEEMVYTSIDMMVNIDDDAN